MQRGIRGELGNSVDREPAAFVISIHISRRQLSTIDRERGAGLRVCCMCRFPPEEKSGVIFVCARSACPLFRIERHSGRNWSDRYGQTHHRSRLGYWGSWKIGCRDNVYRAHSAPLYCQWQRTSWHASRSEKIAMSRGAVPGLSCSPILRCPSWCSGHSTEPSCDGRPADAAPTRSRPRGTPSIAASG